MELLRLELPITSSGAWELADEVACLECLRRNLAAEWESSSEANPRALGNELAAITCEINLLRIVLAVARRVSEPDDLVALGSEVTVAHAEGDRSYVIAGPLAAGSHSGRISFESDLARALLGRRVGEVVDIDLGRGVEQLTVVAVQQAPLGAPGGFRVLDVVDATHRRVIRETDVLREVLRKHPAVLRVLLRREVPAALAEESVGTAARACGIRTSRLLAELQAAADQSCFVQTS